MSRYNAYLGALKFKFGDLLLSGVERRTAWALARKEAAEYAFRARSASLAAVSLQVW